MKHIYNIFIFVWMIIFIAGCVDDPVLEAGIHNALKPTVKTEKISESTANSVTLSGEVLMENGAPVTESGFCWSLESSFKITKNNKKAVSKRKGKFETTIDNLINNKKYFIRAYAINEVDTAYGEVLSFMTKDGLGAVQTSFPRDVRSTSAICGGVITKQGEAKVTERGIFLMQSPEPSVSDSMIVIKMEADSFYCTVTDLKPETQYYYRAFAKNKYGEYNGAQVRSFKTTDGLPVMDDAKFKLVKAEYDYLEFSMSVVKNGDYPILACGFCYSTEKAPTVSNSDTIIVGNGVGDFVGRIYNLNQNKEYYVRAYVTSKLGTVYSQGDGCKSLLKKDLPTVCTNEVLDVISGTAFVGGEILSEGATSVKETGVCWSTKPKPRLDENEGSMKLACNKQRFSGVLENLVGSKTYYVCAYAINDSGIEYGEEVSFTTPNIFTAQEKFPGGFRFSGTVASGEIQAMGFILGGDEGPRYSSDFWGFSKGEWRALRPLPDEISGLTCFAYKYGLWAFGGIKDPVTINNDIFLYSIFENKWETMQIQSDTCPQGIYRPISCTIDKDAYIIGGRRDTLLNEVWQFDMDVEKWTVKPKFPIKQYGGISVVVNDRIYAGLGIISKAGESPIYSQELWSTDSKANVWVKETEVPATGLLSGVAYGKYIYGVDTDGFIWCYDTSSKNWEKKSQLDVNNRTIHCMFVINNEIFIGLGNNSNALIKYDPSWDN